MAAVKRPRVRISTHALREEGDTAPTGDGHQRSGISTHALREEGDCQPRPSIAGRCSISTHALREEGDRCSGRSAGG